MTMTQTSRASAQLQDGYKVDVQVRDFTLRLDEPVPYGGTDTGITPIEMTLAALGACISMVARYYAPQFDIELEDVRVEVEGDVDAEGFFDKSEVRPGFQEVRYSIAIVARTGHSRLDEFIAFMERHCPTLDSLIGPVKLVRGNVSITSSDN